MIPVAAAAFRNFLGHAPPWYKVAIIVFLVTNPLLMAVAGAFVAGWLLLLEFIFTLAMALRCYPLQPGGLLALEAVALGLAGPQAVYQEVTANLPVLLLLMFMVAGIYFLRELLLLIFTRLLVGIRSKTALSLTFCATAAVLSAFLDALTVMAVIITVGVGSYGLFHRVASGAGFDGPHDDGADDRLRDERREQLAMFRAFLRSLLMHAAVGTALGGVSTLVGEPQNLLIGEVAGWHFAEFFLRMAPVSIPVMLCGFATCVALERLGWFGYGAELPEPVRQTLVEFDERESRERDDAAVARLWVQALSAVLLVVALALHVAEIGLIGLAVIVLATALNGVVDERRLGHAFEEALPFTALLVTFFAIVAVIHEQGLFTPVIDLVLAQQGRAQLLWIFVASGILSMVSDNVFVATVYIAEIKHALDGGVVGREQFELLAVAVNAGTNIPSVATPNGQAAFLFLLTSTIAPLIRLGYRTMLWMALPYTVVLCSAAFMATSMLV